jgi:hypothetical protein
MSWQFCSPACRRSWHRPDGIRRNGETLLPRSIISTMHAPSGISKGPARMLLRGFLHSLCHTILPSRSTTHTNTRSVETSDFKSAARLPITLNVIILFMEEDISYGKTLSRWGHLHIVRVRGPERLEKAHGSARRGARNVVADSQDA